MAQICTYTLRDVKRDRTTASTTLQTAYKLFLRTREHMRFLPRETVRVYLNSMSIESPWSLDYKFVTFNLAQNRAYILPDVKRERTPCVRFHTAY